MSASRQHVALFIHSSNEMFGADRVLLQVVDAVSSGGHFTPEVWLPNDVPEADDSLGRHLAEAGVRVSIRPLPILRRRYLNATKLPGLAIRALRLWFRLVMIRPAVVYCATSAVLIAAPIARLAGLRTVVLHMQEIWSEREAPVLGALAASCTSGIAISDAARQSLRGSIATRTRTIYNAVPDRHDPVASIVDTSAASVNFLIAGRWNSWKGHKTLLAAWDRLDEPPGHLTIVGSAPDAGIAADVGAMVSALRFPESVTIVGQVADIVPFIDASAFMIVPSDDPEPFGLVAIESFARRRAVIASAAGGILEIVDSGKNGLLFPPRDVGALTDVLRSVTSAQASVLGEEARRSFTRRFSLERFREQFRAYFAELDSKR